MSFLQAVRDRLREEYEEHVELQNAKTLRVVEFQLQLKTSRSTAKEILQTIDSSAPIPQALEGGDLQGPLYQCLVREEKIHSLQAYCESTNLCTMYTDPHIISLSRALYRSDYFVSWNLGGSPTVSSQPEKIRRK